MKIKTGFRSSVPNTRNTWANPSNTQRSVDQSAYDQLFYSGQDLYVFIVPYYSKRLVPIPVTGFAMGVSQEKVPIYGAWSYKFDAVAKGVKIVRGEFSIVYTKPNFLSGILGDSNDSDYPQKKPITSMETDKWSSSADASRSELRQKIWGAENDEWIRRSETSKSTAYPFGRSPAKGRPEAEYSSHQPFDIVLSFGNNPSMKFTDNSKFDFDTWAYSVNDYVKMIGNDANDGLAPGYRASDRKHIENVELLSVGTVADVSGQPIQETYSFMARDVTTPATT